MVIPFDITGDDGDEPDGSISIEVLDRHDSNYAINPLQTLATTIVRDGDPDPVLAIGDETVSEGDGTIDFEVSYGSGPASQRTITVDYATRDNRAADGRDYTAASGTLTFLPGVDRTATISVPVIQDQSAERTETFYLTLSNPSNATLEDREPSITVVGTIEDDEPVVSIAASVESVPEGQRAVFELTRTGDITGDLTVRIGGSVYNRPISGSNLTASFPAGVSTAQWSYPTVDDSYNSPDYWVNVHVLNPSEFDAPNPQPESTEGVALQ